MTPLILVLLIIQFIATVAVGWNVLIVAIGLFKKPAQTRLLKKAKRKNRFAVVVCARNEEKALPHLLRSLESQNYPSSAWHVYLLADHCIDRTAEIGRSFPFVTVWERNRGPESGKGIVLSWGIKKLLKEKNHTFDALLVFDADNVLSNDFMSCIDEHLQKGNQIVQGNRLAGEPYRTFITKWYATYWCTYTYLFSNPREKLNLSCLLTGTGFAIKKDLLQQYGWNTKTITEDVEYAFQHCIRNGRVSFCVNAVCYDEQPHSFGVMISQLRRWCTGSYQILFRYFGEWRTAFRKKKSIRILDVMLLMLLGPFAFTQLATTIVLNVALIFIPGMEMLQWTQGIFFLLGYVITVICGIVLSRHQGIQTRKLMPGILTFPLFVHIYNLCSFYSLLSPQRKWTPIQHDGLTDAQ